MKAKKLKLGILFGGRSPEHEVSIKSAHSIFEAIDKKKYQIFPIYISKSGEWNLINKKRLNIFDGYEKQGIDIFPLADNSQKLFKLKSKRAFKLDVIFPVLHGSNGEDGSIQGLLKLCGIPFVGPDIAGSAIGMDKDLTKRLLMQSGIPVVPFESFDRDQKPVYSKVSKSLGKTLFIKPARLGSSVGVSKVSNKNEFNKALKTAFKYDSKVLVEKFMPAREIECSILGNDNPKASILGEILPTHEFYSYDAKYNDANGAIMQIPAKLPKTKAKAIQSMAIRAVKILEMEGMSRVDFFYTRQGKIYINEINTIPGFTDISMYPKLWEASGLEYIKLIDELISLALKRHEKQYSLTLDL